MHAGEPYALPQTAVRNTVPAESPAPPPRRTPASGAHTTTCAAHTSPQRAQFAGRWSCDNALEVPRRAVNLCERCEENAEKRLHCARTGHLDKGQAVSDRWVATQPIPRLPARKHGVTSSKIQCREASACTKCLKTTSKVRPQMHTMCPKTTLSKTPPLVRGLEAHAKAPGSSTTCQTCADVVLQTTQESSPRRTMHPVMCRAAQHVLVSVEAAPR